MHPLPPPRSSPSSSMSSATARRVHPSDADLIRPPRDGADQQRRRPEVYTVWKRSSMGFQGTDGFSVYDAAGSLAFRVDNYSRRPKLFAGELLLMDGHGAPLLALRPQILSMRDQWNCYRASSSPDQEEENGSTRRRRQLFSMRKCSLVQSGDEAEVHMCTTATARALSSSSSDHSSSNLPQQQQQQQALPAAPSFRVQGSFWRRSCKIRKGGDGDGEVVARITRKIAGAAVSASSAESVTLGDDVFSLTVMPDADCAMIMAVVVILDRICQKPYTPLMCRSS